MERLQQHGTIFRLGHEGERQPDRGRNQHDGEHIAREERLQQVVRNDRKDVVIVGKRPKLLRHIGCPRSDDLSGQVARRDPHIECKSDSRRRNGRQQCISDSMGKDASRILLRAKRRKRRDDSERDGRHGDELKEAREHRRNEIKQFVQRPDVQPTKAGADNEGEKPQDELPALPALAALCDRRLRRLLDGRMILFFRHDTPSFCALRSIATAPMQSSATSFQKQRVINSYKNSMICIIRLFACVVKPLLRKSFTITWVRKCRGSRSQIETVRRQQEIHDSHDDDTSFIAPQLDFVLHHNDFLE